MNIFLEFSTVQISFFIAQDSKKDMETHTGEKACELSGSGFSTKYKLKRYMGTDTREKPLSSEVCELEFTDRSSLKKHIQTII